MFVSKVKKIFNGFKKIEVSIDQCVHYCGFRYGSGHYNPYESYLIDLTNNVSVKVARKRFIEFLLYYRPKHMSEALGFIKLSKEYPLWLYPWQSFHPSIFKPKRCWLDKPEDIPDILTHFCEQGILSYRIDQEFLWGEQALYSIAKKGYIPEKYDSFITTLQLLKEDGTSTYILLDGNHRVSAMSALGYKRIQVRQSYKSIVLEKNLSKWGSVIKKIYEVDDALLIFNAYFSNNFNYQTTNYPATIIESQNWSDLYSNY
jgi:hypothetical protein